MRSVLLCVFAAVVAGAVAVQAQDACNGQDWGTAGQFDFYVFQQSWGAEFCYKQSYPLCEQPTPYMLDHLTVHGLWPNYNTEVSGHWWPQCCKSVYGSGLNQTAINELATPMHLYWPDEQAQPGYNTSEFWAHEWGKHGTCSGLPQETYFSAALAVEEALGTPELISANNGGSVSKSDLIANYSALVGGGGGSGCSNGGACAVGLTCTGEYLLGVTTCWSKADLQPILCPAEVISQEECPSTISIASFSSSGARKPLRLRAGPPAAAAVLRQWIH